MLRLASLSPTSDKEIGIGCDEQTKEDECVSHFYRCSSASSDAASFAFSEEKKFTDQSSRACFVSEAS
jgi:hypothetical protein